LYRHRKNMTKVSRTPSFTCTIHTNSYGLRDRAPGPRSLGSTPYWAFLGDSLTFGNGVDYDDTFVGVFARAASARGVDVVNLAVGGDELRQQQARFADFIAEAPARPSRVVVVVTAPMLAFFDSRKDDLIVKDGYLFSKNAWVLPYATVMLGNASASYCFFRDGVRKLQARLFPAGAQIARALLEIFSRASRVARPDVAERLEAALAGLDASVRGVGATPVYVYLPSAADLRSGEFLALTGGRPEQYDFRQYERLVERHCRRAGIEFVSLHPTMEREQAKGERMSFAQDPHYTIAMNRVIGEALAAALLAGGV
jgi:hypothetical protein